ncbi:hypothetical protein BpHYR1_037314 [Brachionus plicatilis]|uniref:Uncharacterized protein n=1 Tax=Brachionus plicatilis TaxID=10195 RepID=A0A3M7RYI9_BRAPC|nr:hypothetical protein BpHYR1_037314 [Brachionus plicatilis]
MNYCQLSLNRPNSENIFLTYCQNCRTLEINNIRLFITFINENIYSFRYKMSVILSIFEAQQKFNFSNQ